MSRIGSIPGRRLVGAMALALAGMTLACQAVRAQDWTARYPPNADCFLTIRSAASDARGGEGLGTIVVRPARFGSHESIAGVLVGLAPLGEENPAASGGAWTPDTTGTRTFTGLRAGRYSLVVRGLGYFGRTDTIRVRRLSLDTVVIPLETFDEAYRNRHNCRPRGYRRDGESACVADGPRAEHELSYGRDLARPERASGLELPAIDSSRIVLLRDEATCREAGRVYGRPDDPPRRVIVVRMDSLYLVYDPFEPLAAGEWNLHLIFSPAWRLVTSLAS